MYMFETTTGWMLAVANAALAMGIYRFAMTRSGNAFLWWAIGANALRTLIFAIVVVAVALLGVGHMLSFLVTVCDRARRPANSLFNSTRRTGKTKGVLVRPHCHRPG